jgi:hypothetical protein
MRMNYRPLIEREELDFGTAWHAAMEAYYMPPSLDDLDSVNWRPNQNDARLAFVQKNGEQRVHVLNNSPDPEHDQISREFNERLELGVGMLENYFRWAPTDDDFEPVFVEKEFEVPIINPETGKPTSCADRYKGRYIGCVQHVMATTDGVHTFRHPPRGAHPWVYRGRFDGIVRDFNGAYWILEHKTAKSESSNRQWLQMDEQTGSYIWALRERLHIDIVGVIRTEAFKFAPTMPKVNKTGKTRISVDRRQHTTAELFTQQLTEVGEQLDAHNEYREYMEFLKSDARPKFFHRDRIDRSREQIDDIGRRIFHEARTLIEDPEIVPNVSPMRCNSCKFYGPCLARQDGSDFQYMLDTMFVKRES